MAYRDLREFITQLETLGELRRVSQPVSPMLEMTAVCDRALRAGGPALLFTNPGSAVGDIPGSAIKIAQPRMPAMPVLGNLFGTPRRVALAMGSALQAAGGDPAHPREGLRKLGQLLAQLKEPQPPKGLLNMLSFGVNLLKSGLQSAPRELGSAPCQEIVWQGSEVDLGRLPVQTCWPGDAGPLITWGLTVTRGPHKPRQNLGIYRQQVIAPNKLILRWFAHRGGAQDFRDHALAHPGVPFPVSVALGADPAMLLAAVTPIPDSLSEYQFAGLLRGARTELVRCLGNDLQVPASAEIVLEGAILPSADDPSGWEMAPEGPFGDHTGYYNEVERHLVMTVDRISMRPDPIYHSTYTGKPPDEPSILGEALNEVFVPILQKQFPEIVDFHLPAEGCSYRIAVVSLRKEFPGHARRVMFGIWSFLRQFMYTKTIIVVDDDIDVRDWKEVMWALSTRFDAARDTVIAENTPIDELDFASPVAGLGSKMGLDATNKWPAETSRAWGRVISRDAALAQRVDALCAGLGF